MVYSDILQNRTLSSLNMPVPCTITLLTHTLSVKHKEAPYVLPALGASLLKRLKVSV